VRDHPIEKEKHGERAHPGGESAVMMGRNVVRSGGGQPPTWMSDQGGRGGCAHVAEGEEKRGRGRRRPSF
jgi:hypothetical protein